MKTRLLLTATAMLMGVMGVALSFLPDEILAATKTPSSVLIVLLLKITGALYVGLAMINWMSRGVIMGGIYARPLAMGNLLHFFAAAMALIRHIGEFGEYAWLLNAITFLYILFAAWFGIVVFTHPLKKTESSVA